MAYYDMKYLIKSEMLKSACAKALVAYDKEIQEAIKALTPYALKETIDRPFWNWFGLVEPRKRFANEEEFVQRAANTYGLLFSSYKDQNPKEIAEIDRKRSDSVHSIWRVLEIQKGLEKDFIASYTIELPRNEYLAISKWL